MPSDAAPSQLVDDDEAFEILLTTVSQRVLARHRAGESRVGKTSSDPGKTLEKALCLGCRKPLGTTSATVLILGPCNSDSQRALCAAGKRYIAEGVLLHSECIGEVDLSENGSR